ncbi:1-acyl-sn-glycerol-3-phosphate acyltransferase [Puniceicoccaceae bacterium K14]|nr:1-acyl-sn-glycerol-3-phosphate acyltransferase [Puniceicoccaceae bacterium K14]
MKLSDLIYWTSHSLIQTTYQQLISGEISGTKNIPQEGACILAANHASHLDPPLIGSQLKRKVTFFARKTLWKPGIASWWLDTVGAIPVDRDGESDVNALKNTLKTLKSGGLLTLFPEGTRSPDGNLQTAKPGIGLIAAKSKARIVPCRIFNSHPVLSKESKLPNLNNRIHINYGKPLDIHELDPGKAAGKARYQIIADKIMEAIAKIPKPKAVII